MRTRWYVLGSLPVLGAGLVLWLNYGHQHCIVNASLMLQSYAEVHEGRFPEHVQGFGDAMKLAMDELATDDDGSAAVFSGPGDDGRWLMATGDIDESQASRIYVQGLNRGGPGNIVILFDRYPSRGGDHHRSPWGPLVREVVRVDGSMSTIPAEQWPQFVRQQIVMLTKEGIPEKTAGRLYEMTGWKR